MRPRSADRVVGIDPEGARRLAGAFAEAEATLDAAAARVEAALREAGVDSTAAVTVRSVARWCGGQDADLRRRVTVADVCGAPAPVRAVATPPSPVDEAWSSLLALLGAGAPGAPALRRRRKELAVAAYTRGASSSKVEPERAALGRAGDEHRPRGRAAAAEVAALLAGLGHDEVRALAARALERWDGAEGDEAAALAAALAPLRARVRDQLAAGAAALYQGGEARHVDELAHLTRGLAFAPEVGRGGVVSAFLAGLVAGDAGRRRLDAGQEGARAAGHVVSGLVAAGDVRDTLVNVARRDWPGAGLSAFGLIPFVGDVAKAGDAVKAARRATEAAAAARKKAEELAAAVKGTPLEHWRELAPMPHAARATIDERKFTEYSMHPKGRHTRKDRAFTELGYDVVTEAGRRAGAEDVMGQVRQHLTELPARELANSEHGPRIIVDVLVRGPNGRMGTLETHWQYDHGVETPKLITNFLKVHR